MEELKQRYKILECLSNRHGKAVYIAKHRQLAVKRVIKVLNKASKLFESHLAEAYLLKSLSHPSIPMIIDFEEDDDYVYVIEQYMEGTSLRVVLNSHQLSLNDFYHYIIKLCNVLMYLHNLASPIIHMDIKPENIIVNNQELALIDFGCANTTISGFGTAGYMAPERKNSSSTVVSKPDARTDIYSVGCLMEEMISSICVSKSIQNSIIKLSRRCMASSKAYRILDVKKLSESLLKLQTKSAKSKTKQHNTISIGIAGTTQNVGTTYVALLLAQYLHSVGKSSLYIEKNSSNMVKLLANANPDLQQDNRYYRIFDTYLVPNNWDEYEDCPAMEQFNYLIYDYGVLNDDNIQAFDNSKVKLLISFSRQWESDETIHTLAKLEQITFDKKMYCLFNHTSRKHLSGIRALINEKPINDNLVFNTIPYVPEIILKNNSKKIRTEIGALFNEILE